MVPKGLSTFSLSDSVRPHSSMPQDTHKSATISHNQPITAIRIHKLHKIVIDRVMFMRYLANGCCWRQQAWSEPESVLLWIEAVSPRCVNTWDRQWQFEQAHGNQSEICVDLQMFAPGTIKTKLSAQWICQKFRAIHLPSVLAFPCLSFEHTGQKPSKTTI